MVFPRSLVSRALITSVALRMARAMSNIGGSSSKAVGWPRLAIEELYWAGSNGLLFLAARTSSTTCRIALTMESGDSSIP